MLAVADRIHRYWLCNGTRSTARFLGSRLFRRWEALVFDSNLDQPQPGPDWGEREHLMLAGPENLDAILNPKLQAFLGSEAHENLEGVRKGDLLFLVSDGTEYLHCGYVFFKSRQTRILGEPGNPPLIGCCYTAPAARGKGLYRKALRAELAHLSQKGYARAVIETEPGNTASRKGIEAAGFEQRRRTRSWIVLNKLVVQQVSDDTTDDATGRKWRMFLV